MPVARPRWSASTTRSSSEIADTVNIAEPMPPTPRSRSSCEYDWESPARALLTATMPMPVARTTRSPIRLTRRPLASADTSRMKANAEITAPAAVRPTPNSLGEERDGGRHDAEAHGDREGHRGQHPHLPGQACSHARSHEAGRYPAPPTSVGGPDPAL